MTPLTQTSFQGIDAAGSVPPNMVLIVDLITGLIVARMAFKFLDVIGKESDILKWVTSYETKLATQLCGIKILCTTV